MEGHLHRERRRRSCHPERRDANSGRGGTPPPPARGRISGNSASKKAQHRCANFKSQGSWTRSKPGSSPPSIGVLRLPLSDLYDHWRIPLHRRRRSRPMSVRPVFSESTEQPEPRAHASGSRTCAVITGTSLEVEGLAGAALTAVKDFATCRKPPMRSEVGAIRRLTGTSRGQRRGAALGERESHRVRELAPGRFTQSDTRAAQRLRCDAPPATRTRHAGSPAATPPTTSGA
jgi:hypothetical protein